MVREGGLDALCRWPLISHSLFLCLFNLLKLIFLFCPSNIEAGCVFEYLHPAILWTLEDRLEDKVPLRCNISNLAVIDVCATRLSLPSCHSCHTYILRISVTIQTFLSKYLPEVQFRFSMFAPMK